jgi:transformation/transcription domain-associated protein
LCESIRPLAYSTLADLIHHVRNDLSLQQLVRVIAVYGCISHDSTFPFSIQTMCSKLTQACIESICNKGDKAEAVSILQGVLLTTVEKLKATYKAFDRMKQAALQDKNKTKPVEEEQVGRSGFDAYDWRSIERAMPVLTVAYASDSLETFVRGSSSYPTTRPIRNSAESVQRSRHSRCQDDSSLSIQQFPIALQQHASD